MSKKVYIDTDVCIGCGLCVEQCPEVFEFDDENQKAIVIMPEGGPEESIDESIEACPVECIHWEE